jgi:hypothetical protein
VLIILIYEYIKLDLNEEGGGGSDMVFVVVEFWFFFWKIPISFSDGMN